MRRSIFLVTTAALGFSFAGAAYSVSEGYAGAEACKGCHLEIYEQQMKSGHPYKIQRVRGAPPSYPAGTSPGVPKPPADKTWDDVTYVIGGYGWKARFMDKEGYILTGKENRQFNLANTFLATEPNWTGYSAKHAPRKPYTCGTCHTTGWVKTGEAGPHQDNLPGIHGTWSEPGVRCEACHGPAAEHAKNPMSGKPPTKENCGDCHRRGEVTQIDAKGGLVRHHEQYEDLLASPHKMFGCTTCHNPHKGTRYQLGGYKGEDATCKMCHTNIEVKVAAKAKFQCKDCHMPYAGKSAMAIKIQTADGVVPQGDIKSHIFRIMADPAWNMFTDDGKFVRVDSDGKAYLSVERACLTCHSSQTKAWAAASAVKIHGTP